MAALSFGRLVATLLAGFAAATSLTPAHAAETVARRFVFGTETASRPDAIAVSASTLFSPDRGYGFEPAPASPASLVAGATYVSSAQPFLFSVAVPEGNYLVTATLAGADAATETTIKAESRRLVVERARVAAGRTETRTFAVNVRNARVPPPPQNAPGGDRVALNDRERQNGPDGGLVLHWDDKLTLEFAGARPSLVALEIVAVPPLPTVFLAGDSTVTDQPREPGASWGQMLPRFFKSSVAVANHAESGETMKSFLTGLRLDKLLSQTKPGDWLLLQFGHNDSKANWPQTYVEAGTTYKAYLRAFIAEARRRGVTPILVTSMQRRQFDDAGRIRNSHGDYPAAVRELARDEKVALIDLERASIAFYEALGPERSMQAFSNPRDITHHNNYGAYELAKAAAQGLRTAVSDLATHLVDDFSGYDPAKPAPPETFQLPASAGRTTDAPRGN